MQNSSLKTQKHALRALAKERIDEMGHEARAEASSRIQDELSRFAKGGGFCRIFCYYGMNFEVLTTLFLQNYLCEAFELYMPYCTKDRTLEFYRVSCLNDLKPGVWGIPSPIPDGSPEIPRKGDLVVVPGAAFAKDGRRLGRGGGYYDRFLAGNPALRVGLCFDSVLFDSVPYDMYDISVDLLITETGVKETHVG